MTSENLWGDLPNVSDLRTPLTVLREQASVLATMSGGLLEGHVVVQNMVGQITRLTLSSVAPTLDSYAVAIASVEHEMGFYPAFVRNALTGDKYTIGNEADLKEALRDLLSSPSVRKVLTGLLVQLRTEG